MCEALDHSSLSTPLTEAMSSLFSKYYPLGIKFVHESFLYISCSLQIPTFLW